MKLFILLLTMSLSLVGCSGSKSAQSVNQDTPQIELSDADEFIENPNDDMSLELTDAGEPFAGEPVVADEPVLIDNTMDASADAAPVIAETSFGASESTYTVQKNETLMMIAFKLYGDYGKWKELANYNASTLNGNNSVKEGMQLKYLAPADEFVWNPEGLPYLIRTGDTLGGISTTVYATAKKWKSIWDNNRPLIKDPNKIYAGFTLYYLESNRDVASEM